MSALANFKRIVFFVSASLGLAAQACEKTVFLTLDTGNMRHADLIAGILNKHQVKATFFLANEAVYPDRKRYSLDDSFKPYWQARRAEGHAFGSHTWDHGKFLSDGIQAGVKRVNYQPQFGSNAGKKLPLDAAAICQEIQSVDARFNALTGGNLSRIWRAPGGKTTPYTIEVAQSCGYTHVHWAAAGFLGDELPSETFPNDQLLAKALRDIRPGDILIAHLGIWSRKDPYAPMLDPLIAGLKAKGFCFATLH